MDTQSQMGDHFKVGGAAMLGGVVPVAAPGLISEVEPWLKLLLLAAQVAVAVASVVYIVHKIRSKRK